MRWIIVLGLLVANAKSERDPGAAALLVAARRIRVARMAWNDGSIRTKLAELKKKNPQIWRQAADAYRKLATGTDAPDSIETLIEGDLGTAADWLDNLAAGRPRAKNSISISCDSINPCT